MYPNGFKGELMCLFKRNKNLADYLVSAKLKYGRSMEDQSHLVLQAIGHQIEPGMAFFMALINTAVQNF